MSLPSITQVAKELGIDLGGETSPEQQEQVLVAAMRRDLPLGVEYLHRKAHEAKDNGGSVSWKEDPKSELGKQLIRIHAGDVLRSLASKHFCHGMQLSFVNCCGGNVGKPSANPMLTQIQSQVGPIAYADC